MLDALKQEPYARAYKETHPTLHTTDSGLSEPYARAYKETPKTVASGMDEGGNLTRARTRRHNDKEALC